MAPEGGRSTRRKKGAEIHATVLDRLQALDEGQLREVVRELLAARNYQQITITHGRLEAGRDLVFLEVDPLERRIWRGIQVKTKPLSGRLSDPNSLRAVLSQCEAALGIPYTLNNGVEVRFSEVWVITPHQVSDDAKRNAQDTFRPGRLELIDGPQLRDLVTKHLPTLFAESEVPIERYLRRLKEFGNSPEEYIRSQLKRRFDLSDVFVPPLVTLQVANPKALSWKAARLPGVLAPVADVFAPFLYCFVSSKLPDDVREDAESRLKALHEISVAAERLGATPSIIRDFRKHLETIREAFFQEQIHRLRADVLFDPLFKRLPRLKHRFSDGDSLGRKYAELVMVLTREVKRPEKRRNVVFDAATECYAHAPTVLARLQDSLHAIDQTLTDASSTLQAIESDLVAKHILLAQSVRDVLKTGHTAPIANSQVLATLGSLRQLTEFWRHFCGLSPDDCIDVPCDPFPLVESCQPIILEGELGRGKTTLLKRLCMELSVAAENGGAIPVFVPLAGLTVDPQSSAADGLTRALMDAAKEGARVLNSRNPSELQWILDGLDENSSTRVQTHVLDWLRDSSQPRALAVLASRPATIPPFLSGQVRATLKGFGGEHVSQFIDRFPWRTSKEADDFKEVLQNTPELRDLAATPLLLTLMCVLADKKKAKRLPTRREVLYKLVVELLLGEWDRSKGVERHHSVNPDDTREAVLSRVAFGLYRQHRRFFAVEDFISCCLESVSRSQGGRPDFELFCDELLRDCVLVPVNESNMGFVHFSIHEYLAAVELERQVSERLLRLVMEEFLQTGWWEEVLVFFAGMKKDVTVLIQQHAFAIFSHDTTKAARARRLFKRWLSVAELTNVDEIGFDLKVLDSAE